MQFLSVGEVALRLGVKPSEISNLFYRQALSHEKCPLVGRQRLIPADYVALIAAELRRRGHVIPQPINAVDGVA